MTGSDGGPGQPRQGNGPRLAGTAALILAALASAWSAVHGLALQGVPGAIAAVSRIHPATGLEAVFRLPLGADPAQVAALGAQSRGTLGSAPLMYEPFFLGGLVADRAGRRAEALTLMEEARRRRPNFGPTRFWLMAEYARLGRAAPAIDEAGVVMRIDRGSAQPILPILVQFLRAPEAQPALVRALKDGPVWQTDFFATAAAQKIDPRLTMNLAVATVRAGGKLNAGDQATLLKDLVAGGRYAQAFRFWRTTFAGGGQVRPGEVYDSGFSGAKGAPPFNWTFAASDQGSAAANAASVDQPSHMRASYFGSLGLVLAHQVTLLAPGQYRMVASVQGEDVKGDARLVWRLTCLPGEQVAGLLPITPLTTARIARAAAVTIPAQGCGAQTLALVAEPGEEIGNIDANFYRIAVERVTR